VTQFLFMVLPLTAAAGQSSARLEVTVPDGFRVELIYAVPLDEQGSWVALTPDPTGRLITSDETGRLYRVTLAASSSTETETSKTSVELLDVPIGQVQGLVYAYDSLYVTVNNLNKTAGEDIAQENGLYRLQDTNGDDQFDKVTLIKRLAGSGTETAHGEHGPHGLQLGPDGLIYFVTGNGTKISREVSSTSPYRNWADDVLAHSGQVHVPGGWVARTNRDGTCWEVICGGLRNPYDIAFNLDGELFTCDADSEADKGKPWYRPTRVNHIVSAGEYGWRYDSGPWLPYGKWPDHYPDSVGSVVDIGHGSPAGITFGTGARFPAKYQRALFSTDWAAAKIYAVHTQPDGASYSATLEPFLTGKALAIADVVINHDGDMYFTVGGRKTQSALYRVRYIGNEPTGRVVPVDDKQASRARHLRRCLERFHRCEDDCAVEEAWPHLGSGDRAIRYAARVAIERQDWRLWQNFAIQEQNPTCSIQALLGLARVGSPQLRNEVFARLNQLPWEQLDELQFLDAVRAYSLAAIRMGGSRPQENRLAISRLLPLFASGSEAIRHELGQLLAYLGAPGMTRDELEIAGQTTDAHAETSLKDSAPARPIVRQWQLGELLPLLTQVARGRSYESGKSAYQAAQCAKCHGFGATGGTTGPDLTTVGDRFNSLYLLEALMVPSKVIADKYRNETIETEDGKVIAGHVIQEDGQRLRIRTDPFSEATIELSVERIENRIPSSTSAMPEGLVNVLTQEEVLDLIAYLRAGGDSDDEAFK